MGSDFSRDLRAVHGWWRRGGLRRQWWGTAQRSLSAARGTRAPARRPEHGVRASKFDRPHRPGPASGGRARRLHGLRWQWRRTQRHRQARSPRPDLPAGRDESPRSRACARHRACSRRSSPTSATADEWPHLSDIRQLELQSRVHDGGATRCDTVAGRTVPVVSQALVLSSDVFAGAARFPFVWSRAAFDGPIRFTNRLPALDSTTVGRHRRGAHLSRELRVDQPPDHPTAITVSRGAFNRTRRSGYCITSLRSRLRSSRRAVS